MDRAQASDAWCRRFESAMVRQKERTSLGVSVLFRIMVSHSNRTHELPAIRYTFGASIASTTGAHPFSVPNCGSESAAVKKQTSRSEVCFLLYFHFHAGAIQYLIKNSCQQNRNQALHRVKGNAQKCTPAQAKEGRLIDEITHDHQKLCRNARQNARKHRGDSLSGDQANDTKGNQSHAGLNQKGCRRINRIAAHQVGQGRTDRSRSRSPGATQRPCRQQNDTVYTLIKSSRGSTNA